MTRRRIVFKVPGMNQRYVTPEFNGDKTEFEQFKMGDTCTATWDEIMDMFDPVSSLDEFKAANEKAQRCYVSSIAPDQTPEPVIELVPEILWPNGTKSYDQLFFLPYMRK